MTPAINTLINSPITPMIGSIVTVAGLVATSFMFVDGIRRFVQNIKGVKYANPEDKKTVRKKALVGLAKALPFVVLAAANIMCSVVQTTRLKGLLAFTNAAAAVAAPAAPIVDKIVDKATDVVEATTEPDTCDLEDEDKEFLMQDGLTGQTFKSTLAELNNNISLFNDRFSEDGQTNLGTLLEFLGLENSSLADDKELYYHGKSSRIRVDMRPRIYKGGVIIDLHYSYGA